MPHSAKEDNLPHLQSWKDLARELAASVRDILVLQAEAAAYDAIVLLHNILYRLILWITIILLCLCGLITGSFAAAYALGKYIGLVESFASVATAEIIIAIALVITGKFAFTVIKFDFTLSKQMFSRLQNNMENNTHENRSGSAE